MFDKLLDADYLKSILENYIYLGPFIGIGIPFLESFLPFLPLILIVTINIYLFGPIFGFVFSYIGNVFGSICVFLIFKLLVRNRSKHEFKKFKIFNVERLQPLMLIYSFPFTPSSLVNVSCGLLKVSTRRFVVAVLLGKLFMLTLLALVGQNVSDYIRYRDIKSLFYTLLVITIAYIISKIIEKRFDI